MSKKWYSYKVIWKQRLTVALLQKIRLSLGKNLVNDFFNWQSCLLILGNTFILTVIERTTHTPLQSSYLLSRERPFALPTKQREWNTQISMWSQRRQWGWCWMRKKHHSAKYITEQPIYIPPSPPDSCPLVQLVSAIFATVKCDSNDIQNNNDFFTTPFCFCHWV